MESFFKSLPKIELHAHLNGSLSIKTLRELRLYNLENGESQIDDKTWEEKEKLIPLRRSCSLPECFEAFGICHSLTISPGAVKIATKCVVADFASDNVIYLELRSTLRKESNMTKEQYIQSMIDAVEECKRTTPSITVKLIVSLNRRDSLESSEENIQIALKYSKKFPGTIVGIDLSGDPTKRLFNDYSKSLKEARENGLKVTVHCGEIPNSEEVRDILNFEPDRLGHCTCVNEKYGGNSDVWELLLKSRIPVELCITSNVLCKTIESPEEHHFRLLYDVKHPVTLATDDKGIFGSDLSDEYRIVSQTFHLSNESLWLICYNSIDYIFGDDGEKFKLKEILETFKGKIVVGSGDSN